MAACPVCTVETDVPHDDDEACVAALIESGLFASFPGFNCRVPPHARWTDQESVFAHDLALQAVRWRKAELQQ